MNSDDMINSNKYNKDWISVIVLSYNSDKYIREAIDSIIAQDYPMIELIVTDDGSKNFDDENLKNYIETRRNNNIVNILVIHRDKNVGTVRNINNAITASLGEYIKIIAADDTYPSREVFSRQIQDIKENKTLVSVGMLQQCNEKMNPIKDERVERSNRAIPVVLGLDYVSARKYITNKDIFPLANQAMCYKRDFFINGGLCDEDYILIEDSALALRILKENNKVSFLNLYTVNHRAKVGISTSRELFAPHRLLYYSDCITYSKKEIVAYPEIYGWLYRLEHLRTSKFVYEVALAKKNGSNRLKQILIGMKYLDTVIYYSIKNTHKLKNRLKDRFRKVSM